MVAAKEASIVAANIISEVENIFFPKEEQRTTLKAFFFWIFLSPPLVDSDRQMIHPITFPLNNL